MEEYLEQLLGSTSNALSEETSAGERGAMYYLVDFYKNVLNEAGEMLGIFKIPGMSIKSKRLNLGAKFPDIHSYPEFKEVEEIRNKFFHADRGAPKRHELERLLERGPVVAKEVEELATQSLAQLADAKETGEALKLHFERDVTELKEWFEAAAQFSSLVGESEINTLREDLDVLQRIARDMDPKAPGAEYVHELIRLQKVIDHAKYLYTAGEAMAADSIITSNEDLY